MRRSWQWLVPLAPVVEVLGELGGMSCEGAEPHIHVASLVSELATSMSAFMATAMWNLGQVTLLDDGKGSTWPPSKKLPIYRKYLHSLPDVWLCDFILLIDSFDALILEPEEKLIEIVTGMEQRTGSFAFFGAETWCKTNCSEQDRVAEEHQVKTPYRYLNSGLHIGRLWAMRQFFDEHMNMSTIWAVQDWCINVTLAIPGIAVLDYKQELFMNAFGVEGIWDGQEARDNNQPEGSIAYVKDEVSGKQWVENRITHTRPPILHFPGPGKFPKYFPCFEHPELNCQQSIPFELVRRFMPTAYKGWRLNRMQASLDDFGVPRFLRMPMSPYNFQYQKLWEVVEKFKDRDHLVAGLIAMDVLAVVLLAVYCWWSSGERRPGIGVAASLASRCARQMKKDVVHAV